MDQIKNLSNHRARNKIALIEASVNLFDNFVGHSGGFEGHIAIKNFRSQGRNGGLKEIDSVNGKDRLRNYELIELARTTRRARERKSKLNSNSY